MKRSVFALLLCVAAPLAHAHDPSRALLTLTPDGARVHGRLDVSVRDLEDAVGLDADGDSAITWGEVRARGAHVSRYAAERLAIHADRTPCAVTATQSAIDTHGGAAYVVIDVEAACAAAARSLRVAYALFFDVDPMHRALLELRARGVGTTAVLSAERPAFETDVAALGPWSGLARFAIEGIWHIWHGYDHLAFVTLLVLPIVLGRERSTPRRAVLSIAGVITAFTAAHSLTLALATLGVVSVPARAVESVIALSVLVAALLNVLPRVPRLGAKLAFGFGLVHGLGFASALGDLGAGEAGVAISLAGFNVGVELGQIAVVAAALPLLFLLRSHRVSSAAANYACSAACAVLAVGWLVERLA